MERTLPAKSRHVEPLNVTNWLHKPQRFAVSIERLAADAATRLEGGGHIDVPAGASREYKLTFYSYTQVGWQNTVSHTISQSVSYKMKAVAAVLPQLPGLWQAHTLATLQADQLTSATPTNI